MATSVYFSPKVRSEQLLYEDIVIEAMKFYGQDVYYIPRQMTRDYVLNDIVESTFLEAYAVEMYIEDIQGFGGEGSLMSKFGLEIRDQATFVVARRTWEKLVDTWNNTIGEARPKEGDLIYLPLSKSFFEIKFVEHEQPFYQLNNIVVYQLQCELFEYSNEVVNTGVAEVDVLQSLNANSTMMLIEVVDGEDNHFEIGEKVEQEIDNTVVLSAEVTNIEYVNETQRRLSVSNIIPSDNNYHEFVQNGLIYGQNSGAQWRVVEVYGISDGSATLFPNNPQAQNAEFETTGNNIIDFSESNPFGDPSDLF